MAKTYKILSLLLTYPDAEILKFLPEALKELEKEALLSAVTIEKLHEFADHFSKMDLIDWQAEYVQLFDQSRNVSLYLFEHVKGDSRDRGQAMTDLLEFYRENGLEPSGIELPDHLPVFLEFLSTLPAGEASEVLAGPINIINSIYITLCKKDNMYRYPMEAIISLSSDKPD